MANNETRGFGEPVTDAGLSWGGFNLHGDRKSIDEARRLLHRDERCGDLEKIVLEQRDRIAALERQIAGYQRECHEVEQRLGKALGYPYANHTICEGCDPVAGCTCGTPLVIVGEHTPGTLAAEAANRIAELERQTAEPEERRANMSAIEDIEVLCAARAEKQIADARRQALEEARDAQCTYCADGFDFRSDTEHSNGDDCTALGVRALLDEGPQG